MSIYLDYNASTPLGEAARTAMWSVLESGACNASSVHGPGRRARAAVERARRQVAGALKVAPGELVFCSGATEALHMGIVGFLKPGDQVVISAVEHPAVWGACEVAGAEVSVVPVDAQGRLNPANFAAEIHEDTRLVVVMGAQNEIGSLYPIQEIVAAVNPVPVLADLAQLFGKQPIDLKTLGCAAAVVSGHKIGGPQGVGALWLRPDFKVRVVQAGGPQERGRRAGTENVAAIAGFGAAAAVLPQRIQALKACSALRDELEAGLSSALGEAWCRHGAIRERLPNTSAFRVRGVDGDILLAALDLEGIAISSGSACSSGTVEPSRTLRAMGLSVSEARGGLRVSLGPETQRADIERLVEVLPRLVARALAALGGKAKCE